MSLLPQTSVRSDERVLPLFIVGFVLLFIAFAMTYAPRTADQTPAVPEPKDWPSLELQAPSDLQPALPGTRLLYSVAAAPEARLFIRQVVSRGERPLETRIEAVLRESQEGKDGAKEGETLRLLSGLQLSVTEAGRPFSPEFVLPLEKLLAGTWHAWRIAPSGEHAMAHWVQDPKPQVRPALSVIYEAWDLLSPRLPTQEVQPGMSWSRKIAGNAVHKGQSESGRADLDVTYTVIGEVEREGRRLVLLSVRLAGPLSVLPWMQEGPAEGPAVRMDVEGAGLVWWDATSGQMRRSDLRITRKAQLGSDDGVRESILDLSYQVAAVTRAAVQ